MTAETGWYGFTAAAHEQQQYHPHPQYPHIPQQGSHARRPFPQQQWIPAPGHAQAYQAHPAYQPYPEPPYQQHGHAQPAYPGQQGYDHQGQYDPYGHQSHQSHQGYGHQAYPGQQYHPAYTPAPAPAVHQQSNAYHGYAPTGQPYAGYRAEAVDYASPTLDELASEDLETLPFLDRWLDRPEELDDAPGLVDDSPAGSLLLAELDPEELLLDAGCDEVELFPEEITPAPTGGRAAARTARGRNTRRRSVLLTVALPSVAVLGIAGATAATLVPGGTAPARPVTAGDAAGTPTVADEQAKELASKEAQAAAQEAGRAQARQALALRTAVSKMKAAEAPKYVLPITAHTGLSALYGQVGSHWMSLHTGIDFPVGTGTNVHAVTGGTVSTEWNTYYGNMLILTAPDGTQTWYCHLSAYRVRSGSVKAGDVVAYSGNTGNTTGPHLHFEVHPHGGVAVDPLPWLLQHGLDPR